MNQDTAVLDYEAWLAEHDVLGHLAENLGMDHDETKFAAICVQLANGDDSTSIDLAMQPMLMSIAAEDAGAPAEYHDPASWRRLAIAAHHAATAMPVRPQNKTVPPKTKNVRTRAPRNPRRTAKTSGGQDPGGDPDPDPDPVQRRVNELVETWPPFSDAMRARLGQLLGGAPR